MTRRTFSASVLGAAATAAFSQTLRPIRLGAPIFLRSDAPEALAKEHRRLSYTAAQFPPFTRPDTKLIADPRNITKEFFDATVENCRKVIDAVKPKRSKFTIEMMFASLPDGPDSYLQLIKAVDRKEFGVHVDVCNVLNSPDKYYNSGKYIDELFKKLGPWVLSCHAKDLTIPGGLSLAFVEVVPGRGIVDYKSYLRNLAPVPREAPLMLEHFANDDEFQEGANFIRKQGAEVGVTFV